MSTPNLHPAPDITDAVQRIEAAMTSCESTAHYALTVGSPHASQSQSVADRMLARATGLGDAYALIAGRCRDCDAELGERHIGRACRSAFTYVGGVGG
jgi:hypothetical protein